MPDHQPPSICHLALIGQPLPADAWEKDPYEVDNSGWCLLASMMHARRMAEVPEHISLQGKDNTGCTPLHWAARWALHQEVALLLRKGVDPTSRNNKGETPKDMLAITLHEGPKTETALAPIRKLLTAAAEKHLQTVAARALRKSPDLEI